jgi:light-regulated signal transduction histidine kinase (bacteriophytochrome)
MGLILFEMGPMIGIIYATLRAQISGALKGALLFQERQKAQSELERSNKELEQFAYVASHDLQEPLRMVASYLQLLEMRYKDKLDADAQEFIAFAVNGAIQMKQRITDLLTYSRVDTHSRPFRSINCEHLLAKALSNLEVAVKENSAVITHDPLPTVMADASQLMEVFQHLTENAIKFHADRQPHVHISAEQRGGEWLFSVRDNGIGIAPEYVERVFAIFSRLHTQARYPGTGIGLAICKRVVEHHGGRIWVESQPGEGSTFFFTIPSKGN